MKGTYRPLPPVPGWMSHPDQVAEKVREWERQHPQTFMAESVPQFTGRPVWALTVTDRRVPDGPKKKLLVFKPHAHEPAPIAGQVNIINTLLEGETLDRRPGELDRERVLRQALITFILDANPDGTARAPVEYWDGSRYDNEEFWSWMRGLDPETGRMWKRVDLWDDRTERPLPSRYGIVYEPVGPHEYVEPNRHHRSTLFRWLFKLWERYEWDLMLDLHQTEFEGQEENCMVILPTLFEEQPEAIRRRELAWGERLVSAWAQTDGGRPVRDLRPLGYTGQQRQYFIDCWGELEAKTPLITSEIQNNNPRTPPFVQMRLNEVAVRATVEYLLGG
jgi:hypothetical protein